MKFTFPPEAKPLDGYTIKRAIHRGGFGEVYYALSDGGKEVALKLLQHNLEVELRGVAQCLNLKHPNLITIFDIRTDSDGDHWIVMEYVSGKSLDNVLATYPEGMPLEEVERWLAGMAAGLGFLHDRGVVHRDLKPANVYREQGVVKIGDVGLSKFISESRRGAQTQSVGTVYYMAPEVAHGRYGREVDIYSLGVVLYEMLCGRVPFDGETTGEILMKHLSERPDLSPIPKRLRPVLSRALEKDPARRTSDAAQLLKDFRDAVRGIDLPYDIPEESFFANGSAQPHHHDPKRHVQIPSSGNDRGQPVPVHTIPVNQTAPVSEPKVASPPNPVPDAPVDAEKVWYTDLGIWLRVIGAVVIVVAVFAPSALPALIRALFIAGIYGALGYAGYRIFRLLVPPTAEPVPSSPVRTADKSPPVTHAEPPPPPPVEPSARDRFDQIGSLIGERVEQEVNHRLKQAEERLAHQRLKRAALSPETRRSIPLRQRFLELSGSLTFAVPCTVLLTLGLALITSMLPDRAAVGQFGITTLFAAWAILAASKLWEGSRLEGNSRRIGLFLLGLLVGSAAYGLQQSLLITTPAFSSYETHSLVHHIGSRPLVDANLQPTLPAYLLFFGSLFALRRWWWQADTFRAKRFRILSGLVTMGLAYLLTLVFAFPPTWGMVWALTISCVVQLSAVWMSPAERLHWLEGNRHA